MLAGRRDVLLGKLDLAPQPQLVKSTNWNKMTELDSLIDSSISLISLADVRYDGILFSINPEESSIVLKEGLDHTTYKTSIIPL